MNTRIDPIAFGYTGAIISSIGMFIMWVLGGMGYYTEAVIMMERWHIFFSLNLTGLIGGILKRQSSVLLHCIYLDYCITS